MHYEGIENYVETLAEEERTQFKDIIAVCKARELEIYKIRNKDEPEIQRNLKQASESLMQKIQWHTKVQ